MNSFYIHDTVIPQMLEEMEPELGDQSEEKNTAKLELLKRYGLANMCADTIGICLKKLVFLYDVVLNPYCVDRHDNRDTIWYRHNFIDQYLPLERRMHRWIQMNTEELKKKLRPCKGFDCAWIWLPLHGYGTQQLF